MSMSEIVFAAMGEAAQGPSGKALKRKFKGSVLFKITDTDEVYFLDLKSDNCSVSKKKKGDDDNNSSKADLEVEVTSENMTKLISGELKPQQAFMKGKLKIKGKMNLAMKLTAVLVATKKKMPKSKL
mmetsp:Transcript_7590/g.9467  ORF Transcript_7590/g.9467 Transcript_7590/m.9467 type:complete len:127 (+) Transcript_7590:87-467(+)